MNVRQIENKENEDSRIRGEVKKKKKEKKRECRWTRERW